MALPYRAIWADERDDLIVTGRSAFQDWIGSKKLDLLLPESGAAACTGADAAVASVTDGDAEALRIRLNGAR